jgi:tRNA-modifying protein YgfZ
VDAQEKNAYTAALEGAAFRAEPAGVLDVSGPSRESFLHGQLANEVRSLRPGDVVPTAALTPQGKLLYIARVIALENCYRLVLPRPCLAAARENLTKFAAFDRVTVEDRSEDFMLWALTGPAWGKENPAEWIGAAAPRPGKASLEKQVAVFYGEGDIWFFLLAPRDDRQTLETRLTAVAMFLPDKVAEIRRVEEGRPLWGIDIDASNVPDEAGLESWVSTVKGCYVGQEVVARMRTYGRPARRLAAFRLEADSDAAPGETLLRAPEDSRPAGRLTSVVRSPRAGAIALGYAMRGVYESPGTRLLLASGGTAVLAERPVAAAGAAPPRA